MTAARVYPPLRADQPVVANKMACAVCAVVFVAGDETTVDMLVPGDEEEAERARQGLAYNASGQLVHAACAGKRPPIEPGPAGPEERAGREELGPLQQAFLAGLEYGRASVGDTYGAPLSWPTTREATERADDCAKAIATADRDAVAEVYAQAMSAAAEPTQEHAALVEATLATLPPSLESAIVVLIDCAAVLMRRWSNDAAERGANEAIDRVVKWLGERAFECDTGDRWQDARAIRRLAEDIAKELRP